MSLSLATGMQIICSTNRLVATGIDPLIDRLPVSGSETPIVSTFTRE
jgi:hypothetical protein